VLVASSFRKYSLSHDNWLRVQVPLAGYDGVEFVQQVDIFVDWAGEDAAVD
jgi:hypothetical protein